MADISPEAEKYLKEHTLCVFATGRKDGSPQQSLIGYQFDGKQFLLGGQATSFKMKNLARNPGASMAIIDGQRQLIVYGNVAIVDDEAEVLRLHRERIKRIAMRDETEDELKERLIREQRVVLVLTPERFYPASMPTA